MSDTHGSRKLGMNKVIDISRSFTANNDETQV